MYTIISLLTLAVVLVLVGHCYEQGKQVNRLSMANNQLDADLTKAEDRLAELDQQVQALNYIELKVNGYDESIPYDPVEEVNDAAA